MERNQIGIITKPQALKGEFRVKPALLNLKYYKSFKVVYIANHEYEVERVSIRDTFVIFKVKGIDSCESAETYRNQPIFADMEVVARDDGDYMDYKVFVGGEEIGKIVDINNYGSKDVWSISGKDNMMLPFIDGLIESKDEENMVISLKKELFEQVAVYEN
ncbi:MAG: hypothetical protein E7354_02580 [Clostridiales bacterium]|nr:hypothetical protein [Clostridiales bacterium]